MLIRTLNGRIWGVAAERRPKGRSYDDACASAHALDLVGERWALLVVRELVLGPKRFTDLRAGLPGVSPNVLAERLRGLEAAGVVRRGKLPPPAASRIYELTDWGLELEPVIVSLGRWGARSPLRPHDAGMGIDSLILSFRTMFDPLAAEGLDATYELRIGEDRFRAAVSGGRLEIERGEAVQARRDNRGRRWDADLAGLRGRGPIGGGAIRQREDRGRPGGGRALLEALPVARAGASAARRLARQRVDSVLARRWVNGVFRGFGVRGSSSELARDASLCPRIRRGKVRPCR